MLRCVGSALLLCRGYYVPSSARVGIFALHLDPPTVQHQELFRLLVARPEDNEARKRAQEAELICGQALASLLAVGLAARERTAQPTAGEEARGSVAAAGVIISSSSSDSSIGSVTRSRDLPSDVSVPPFSTRHPRSAGLGVGDGAEPAIPSSSGAQRKPAKTSLWYLADFAEVIAASELAPFDHLIVVPNTRYPVSLSVSSHLAALSVLATRDIDRVHVDFTALEHPDESMPCIYDLTQQYKNSTIIHWLQDAHEMQNWSRFCEMRDHVPLLLLKGEPIPAVHPGARQQDDAHEGHTDSATQAGGCAPAGVPVGRRATKGLSNREWWLEDCEDGENLLDISPAYSNAAYYSSAFTAFGSDGDEYASGEGGADVSLSEEASAGDSDRALPPSPIGSRRLPTQSKVKVRDLVEDLLPHLFSPNHRTVRVEVHSVPRCNGADVRQSLWERQTDPHILLSDSVLRYIESHSLYRDYRKGSFQMNTPLKSKVIPRGNDATVAFPGLVPRLELHHDKNNLLAQEQYEKLKVFQCVDGKEPDLIVPIGGDGYMMHCIRKNWRRFIPFYGVNAGHVGYLLNDCSTLEELFSAPLKLHTVTMLYCQAEKETESGEKVLLSELAFNDAWVERSSGQTALIRILVNGEERIRRLRGDGVLVSTAAGSTAYSQALGASPVPVGAPLIQVVGSNVVSPAQWRPAHLNQEDQVEFEVIDSFKRPCRCFVDSVDVGNVTRMVVRSSRVASASIAFSSSCDLQQKLYQVQFPKTL